jgi:hypothetical protein
MQFLLLFGTVSSELSLVRGGAPFHVTTQNHCSKGVYIMRKIGWFISCSILILGSVTLVDGQQPGGGKGGFGGFGGGQQTPLNMLNRADVKKELEVTDEQLEKLPAEILVAISKVLSEKQFKRFKQIDLQNRKNAAFKDPAVQSALKMSDEQKKNIGSILEDETKEIAELFKGGKGGFGGFGKGSTEKSDNIRKETKEKIYTVLSKEQRTTYRELIGEEFKFQQPTFGGGGFGKDKKKAKDTE